MDEVMEKSILERLTLLETEIKSLKDLTAKIETGSIQQSKEIVSLKEAVNTLQKRLDKHKEMLIKLKKKAVAA